MGQPTGSVGGIQGPSPPLVRGRGVAANPLPQDDSVPSTIGDSDELTEDGYAHSRRPSARSLYVPRPEDGIQLLERHERTGLPHASTSCNGCTTTGASPHERPGSSTTHASPSAADEFVARAVMKDNGRFGRSRTRRDETRRDWRQR